MPFQKTILHNSSNSILSIFFATGIVIFNCFYFIPKTIEWLTWRSGVTMAYVGIELVGNYFIHIFLLFSCLFLINIINKNFEIFFLFFFMLLLTSSFVFAYRIIEWVILIVVGIYIGLFYLLVRKSRHGVYKNNSSFVVNGVGFILSFIWLIIDNNYLN